MLQSPGHPLHLQRHLLRSPDLLLHLTGVVLQLPSEPLQSQRHLLRLQQDLLHLQQHPLQLSEMLSELQHIVRNHKAKRWGFAVWAP